MNRIKYLGMMIALLFTALSFNACSSDDDEVSIDSYLKGKWHTYKAVVSVQNQAVDLDITKTGQYSQLYFEAIFKDGNKVDMSYYEVDDNTASRWETETYSYSIKGDIVTIYDEKDAIDLFFSPKEKNMYMRVAKEVENVYTTVFLYFRK